MRSISEYILHPLSNRKLQRRNPQITYVRLNPVGGLATIDLAEFTRRADIKAITNQYLEIPEVADQVEDLAASIHDVSRTVVSQTAWNVWCTLLIEPLSRPFWLIRSASWKPIYCRRSSGT